MRGRRHTIAAASSAPSHREPPTNTVSLVVVDEGSSLTPPSATLVDLNLPESATLPAWNVIASALMLQAPGCWVSSTRYVVIAMYAPGISIITDLAQWEDGRKTPLERISYLTILRADQGLPLPTIPGAGEAHARFAQLLETTRPSQPLRSALVSPLNSSDPLGLARPTFTPDDRSPLSPIFERRGRPLPTLNLDYLGYPLPLGAVPDVNKKAKATPLGEKTSWGNWFAWSP